MVDTYFVLLKAEKPRSSPTFEPQNLQVGSISCFGLTVLCMLCNMSNTLGDTWPQFSMALKWTSTKFVFYLTQNHACIDSQRLWCILPWCLEKREPLPGRVPSKSEKVIWSLFVPSHPKSISVERLTWILVRYLSGYNSGLSSRYTKV